jgi:predicted membrane chloride channel (bestrophin family)
VELHNSSLRKHLGCIDAMDVQPPGIPEAQPPVAMEDRGKAELDKLPLATPPPVNAPKAPKYVGGEGVLIMNAAKKGYWKETALAYHGRPAPVITLTLFGLYSVGAVSLSMLYNLDDEDKPQIMLNYTFAAVAAPALFFLLVFRTNAAYDRWWDGRKHWGMLINRTRDFARQAVSYIGDDKHVEELVRYTIAFAVTTKVHLRVERDVSSLVRMGVLSNEQVLEIQKAKHMPNFVLEVLSESVASAKASGLLTEIGMLMVDSNLTQYEDDLGAC